MKSIAARLGCSEGRVATLAIGLVFGLVTAAWGIPPVVRDRPRPPAAAAAASPRQPTTPMSSTSTGQAPTATDGAAALAPVTAGDGPAPEPGAANVAPAADAPGVVGTLARVGLFTAVASPGAPEGVVVAPDGTVYVATNNAKRRGRPGPSKVLHYDARGTLIDAVTITGQPADRTAGLTGLAVEPRGSIVVADGSTGRLLRLAAGAAPRTVATLFDLPPCLAVIGAPVCEPGSVDHRPLPRGVVADASGVLYVTDAGQSTIWRIDATGLPLPLHSDGQFTGARALGGVTITEAGQLLFTAGSVLALPVDGLGRAGTRTTFAAIPEVDGALALAPAAGGGVYVTLARANAVLVLDRRGDTVGRITSGDGDAIPFDAPSGIAVAGRRLLVSNQSTGDAAHWAVLTVPF